MKIKKKGAENGPIFEQHFVNLINPTQFNF